MKTASWPALLILCGIALGFGACAAQPGGDGPSARVGDEGGTGGGEVPDELLAEIVDHLLAATGAERAAVEVLRAQAVTWRDGSLGCPEPGMMYMQVLTGGYWVILRHSGREYDYRAGRGGGFLLCEQKDRAGPLG